MQLRSCSHLAPTRQGRVLQQTRTSSWRTPNLSRSERRGCSEARSVAEEPSLPSTSSTPTGVPWGLGFQMNERYLAWDDSAAIQLIKLHLSHKLELSVEEVEERLQQLGRLVPDIINKLPRMRADILLSLIRDPAATTRQLLGLRELLPNTNISELVTRWPFIMMDYNLVTLEKRLKEMSDQLPGIRIEALVDLEPQLLKVDLPLVLTNIKRLMPNQNPVDILVAQPHMVLDMQQSGMDSALDVEGIPIRRPAL